VPNSNDEQDSSPNSDREQSPGIDEAPTILHSIDLTSVAAMKSFANQGASLNVLGNQLISKVLRPSISVLKILDSITPSFLRNGQIIVSANILQSVGLQSIAAPWRSMLAMENSALKTIKDLNSSAVISNHVLTSSNQLLGLTRSATELAEWANRSFAINSVNLANIASITNDTRKYLDQFAAVLKPYNIINATLSSFTLSALLADVILAHPNDPSKTEETIEQVESRVFEPWEEARLSLSIDLVSVLEQLDTRAAEHWKGAWEEFHRPRSAAVSKIAHGVVEAISWALRSAAPDKQVKQWMGENPPGDFLDGNGRPSRKAKTAFILDSHPAELKLVQPLQGQIHTQLGELMEDLQGAKHASNLHLIRVRALMLSAESLLTTLLLVE
jgi:hypothetical protein